MTCFSPISGWYSSTINSTGKRSLVFDYKYALPDSPIITVGCGKCKGCRIDRSRENATKMVLENELHRDSIFLTLTYDEEHLPLNGSLVKKDLQDFLKRLRFYVSYHYDGLKIRFFAAGEYGGDLQRPHYHVIIYGYMPSDKRRYKDNLFTSATIEKIWNKGWCPFGLVTFESCAYVARYILKKINGDLSEFYYDGLQPEFVLCSNRPGIGYDWIVKYADDVLRDGYIVIRNGVKVKPPKYFMQYLETINPKRVQEIKDMWTIRHMDMVHQELEERDILKVFDYDYYFSDYRHFDGCIDEIEKAMYEHHVLPVKRQVTEGKLKMLKRGYEDGSY